MIVVIGGGVFGLAIGWSLAQGGYPVTLENNLALLHAGIHNLYTIRRYTGNNQESDWPFLV